ncbi:tetratricopeptide repeat protein [Oscillatoria sp. FACHB-1407]|uniref:tetratricopeptide repeat protein n=1 Tax=Oscillatoria sp. FACHB-1407 TaxID=2692847 RepID=UPI001687E20B|nr:tetratricopeptide repeat protein [Oscillatoria sp. FACHB-1407]MBD2459957.1 tetratricopeptide repeat protein [Oscillatoria sp. FACHB-1407]
MRSPLSASFLILLTSTTSMVGVMSDWSNAVALAQTNLDAQPTYQVGQVVEVLWEQSWWVARVLRIEGNQYCITYEGWDSAWDECVGSERIRSVADAETLQALGAEAGRLHEQSLEQLNRSEFQAALQSSQRALEIYRQIGNRMGEGIMLSNLGQVYDTMGQYPQALESYQQALSTHRDISNRSGESNALNGIGLVYSSLGQYPQALEFYQQALVINQHLGNRSGEATNLNNIGSVYDNLGQYPRALEYYQQSLTISYDLGDRESEATSLNNFGLLYNNLGQSVRALDYYQQALTINRDLGDRTSEATNLNNIGAVYAALGDYSQALEQFQQVLVIRQEVGDRAQEGTALNNIGFVYQKLNQEAQALEVYQRALAIAREIGNRRGESITLGNIGKLYFSQGQYSQALEAYQQALPIAQETGYRVAEGRILDNLGELLAAQNQLELAIVSLKQSVNVWETIRGELRSLSTEQQQAFTDQVADTYRELAALLLQQDRVLEAQEVLDLLKLQELEDYLHNIERNEQISQGIYLWDAEVQIIEQYQQAIAQGQAIATVANSIEVDSRVAELQRIAREQRVPENLLTKLQDNLRQLDRPAALLYPLILEDRLEVVVVLPNSPPVRHTVAVTQPELETAIRDFRQYLTQRTNRRMAPAQQLYDWLIRPIAADLHQAGVETLLYAADGQLRYIPLAALHDGEQWLVERFTINQITAASLTNFESSREPNLRVLAGAYSDRQLVYEFAIGDRQFAFNGLEFAGSEVEAIASTIPQTTTFLNRDFSRAKVEPQLEDYTVIHLATHAEFVRGVPEESFILFGNGDRLSLRELSGLSLPNVDLVVLSACRTAVSGELGNGEELLGFGYQMQQTGADAAIASLWYVNDGGTQMLMTAFYAALQQGMSEADALRQAQMTLINSDSESASTTQRLTHPYYWAPFILIGNGL